MPVLADYLKSIDSRNEARAAELKSAFKTEVRVAETQLREAQSLQLQAFLVTGLQAAAIAVLLPVLPLPLPLLPPPPAQSGINNNSRPTSLGLGLEPELEPELQLP